MSHRFSQLSEVQRRLTSENCERWYGSVSSEDAIVQDLSVVLDHTAVADDDILSYVDVASDALRADDAPFLDVNIITDFHRSVRQLATLLVPGRS